MVTPVDDAQVGCVLGFDVTTPVELVLQIAPVASSTSSSTPPASTLSDGQMVLRAEPGPLTISYAAAVPTPIAEPPKVTEIDRIVALRPSRYCPSDRLGGFAGHEFG